ncbi:SH3 domain-containing protein [Phenylobacterium immobile]|uniref:SH3 domain-containing protein n=1 Tax=Phenylobacterium immobile TaxID=21 RepID=UPI000B2A6349|nr:SH3 domain-containing protein [Phenylobacterium immobile]
MRAARRTLLAVAVCLAGVGISAAAKRETPSGLAVPRYVVLKFDRVNARAGPGDDHRLVWVYRAKGLPVQVVAETVEWRRVCDPQGNLAWIHRRTTDGRRAVMNMSPAPIPLLGKPKTSSTPNAYLARRAIADLDRCEAGWCRVKVAGVRGWAPERLFWGVSDRPQCR